MVFNTDRGGLMTETLTYIVTLVPSVTSVLTVIVGLLVVVNKVTAQITKLVQENQVLKDAIQGALDNTEVAALRSEIKRLAAENARLSKQFDELIQVQTHVQRG